MIIDLKRCILACVLVSTFAGAGAHDSFSQHHAVLHSVSAPAVFWQTPAPASPTPPLYETRANHDPNGTGKFYMGREIAQVMGPGGIEWLDRPEREEEEHPAKVLDSLDLRPGDVVADLGAGSGYFTFRIAPKVGKNWQGSGSRNSGGDAEHPASTCDGDESDKRGSSAWQRDRSSPTRKRRKPSASRGRISRAGLSI